jgi:hypothetical protein
LARLVEFTSSSSGEPRDIAVTVAKLKEKQQLWSYCLRKEQRGRSEVMSSVALA